MFVPCYSYSQTLINPRHSHKNKNKPEVRVQLSSTFSGSSFHITSDAYNDENAPPSTMNSMNLNTNMNIDPMGKECSTPKSMDFVEFDGKWDDFNDKHQETPEFRCSERLWHFMQFEPDENDPSESKNANIQARSKSKFLSKRSSNKDDVFSSTRRIKISDKDNACSEGVGRNPLQTLTNKLGVKVQQLAKKSPTFSSCNPSDPTPKMSNLSNSNQSQKRTYGIVDYHKSVITPTLSTSATEPLSDDDDDDLFWNEFQFNTRADFGRSSESNARDLSTRYSRRSDINNGSKAPMPTMGQITRRDLRPNAIHVNASYWSEQNRRAYMEDRFILDRIGSASATPPVSVSPKEKNNLKSKLDMSTLFTKLNKIRGIDDKNKSPDDRSSIYSDQLSPRHMEPISAFGIFDGHAGSLASQFCSDHFSWYLSSQIMYPTDITESLRCTFNALDQDFVSTGNADGTTANACIVVGGQRVICANAGDSRAIIVKKDGSFIALSVDHKPEMPKETKRITELGGKIIHSGTWRVQG